MLLSNESFKVDEITVFRAADEEALFYTAPDHLRVARNLNGTPSFSLLFMGEQAALMLETTWDITDHERRHVLEAIVRRYAAQDADALENDWRLLPVPVNEATAALTLYEYGREPEPIAQGIVSGFGSMRATFHVTLPSALTARLERALEVEDADIVATYHVETSLASTVSVNWTLDLARAKQWLANAGAERLDQESLLSWLPELIEQGLLNMEVQSSEPPNKEQFQQIQVSLAKLLLAHLESTAEGTLNLREETSVPVPLILHPQASLKEALAGQPPASYMVGRK